MWWAGAGWGWGSSGGGEVMMTKPAPFGEADVQQKAHLTATQDENQGGVQKAGAAEPMRPLHVHRNCSSSSYF